MPFPLKLETRVRVAFVRRANVKRGLETENLVLSRSICFCDKAERTTYLSVHHAGEQTISCLVLNGLKKLIGKAQWIHMRLPSLQSRVRIPNTQSTLFPY